MGYLPAHQQEEKLPITQLFTHHKVREVIGSKRKPFNVKCYTGCRVSFVVSLGNAYSIYVLLVDLKLIHRICPFVIS